MLLIASLFFSLCLASSAWGWQHSETEEYVPSEDMFPTEPKGWMEISKDKRNTWWTKKSIQDEMANGCRIGRCLVMFKDCLRHAENKSLYLQCKESQFSCMADCLRQHRDRTLMTSAPMSS